MLAILHRPSERLHLWEVSRNSSKVHSLKLYIYNSFIPLFFFFLQTVDFNQSARFPILNNRNWPKPKIAPLRSQSQFFKSTLAQFIYITLSFLYFFFFSKPVDFNQSARFPILNNRNWPKQKIAPLRSQSQFFESTLAQVIYITQLLSFFYFFSPNGKIGWL